MLCIKQSAKTYITKYFQTTARSSMLGMLFQRRVFKTRWSQSVQVNRMVYQPGTSLMDHINKFKGAYTRLTEQTTNNMQDFGIVTSFMAAALFLESLKNNIELTAVIQMCYDLQPFSLKTVTDQVSMEAV